MLDNLHSKNIILASKSPRRQELLKGLDIEFTVQTRDIDESYPADMIPEDIPEFLALKKAHGFQDIIEENTILITSDTIVILENKVLEKPKTELQAKKMIKKLSNATHIVVTGVCIKTKDETIAFSDHTVVKFMPLTDAEIEYYVQKYKPFDKAGAYGVQEWIGYIGIERLEGSYYNVMGLPVHKVYQALAQIQ
ncbi:Maf family nucleotide pyrophosphatase [Crocinitomix sp.]|nr:Maf family nucleotide pyrophosphatase [Crocinitomix sp.]